MLVWRYRHWGRAQRLNLFVLPPAFAALLLLLLGWSIQGALTNHSAGKLTPTIALQYGYRLFYGADDGPILNTIYGPLAYLVFWPTSFAATPTGALLIAVAINILFYFVPLYLLLGTAVRERTDVSGQLLKVTVFALVIAATYSNPITRTIVSQVHADGPVVGLSLLSCVLLYNAGRTRTRSLAAAAILAAMAVWMKQTAIPLVIAQGFWLLVAWGWQRVSRYLLFVVMAATLMGVVFAAIFGPEPLWFNMIVLPSRHDVALDFERVLHSLRLIFSESLVPVLIILVAAFSVNRRTALNWRDWFRREAWVLPALLAVFVLPTNVAAHLKAGGFINNLHSNYYLLAAAATALVQHPGVNASALWKRAQAWVAMVLLVVGLVTTVPAITALDRMLAVARGGNPVEEAYRYARAHPGEVYFPWLPLASLMAEGRLYHFDLGVLDYHRAGLPPSADRYRAYLPETMQYVAMPKYGGIRRHEFSTPPERLAYLRYPQVTGELVPVEQEGLQNFNVYRVEAGQSAGEQ